jgi:DNA helicase II / ATP-dependent DNA helicase PcrA
LFEAAPLIADLQNTIKKFGGKNECKKRIYAFEASWARLQNHTPGWPADDLDRKFHANLIEWLKFHRGMLIGELIPLALNYLKNNPYSDELGKYKHIIVDEYQDLNKAEQTLLKIFVYK